MERRTCSLQKRACDSSTHHHNMKIKINERATLYVHIEWISIRVVAIMIASRLKSGQMIVVWISVTRHCIGRWWRLSIPGLIAGLSIRERVAVRMAFLYRKIDNVMVFESLADDKIESRSCDKNRIGCHNRIGRATLNV